MKEQIKPRQILLSKRANVFYLEHVRVLQQDGRIIYLADTGSEIERFFNIPERNTAFLLLGKGSSVTDAAARRLAESNVVVGFVGNGGAPFFSAVDIAFLTPQSEYRPTEYMQAWARMWFDEPSRLAAAKLFLLDRLDFAQACWKKNKELGERSIFITSEAREAFTAKIAQAESTGQLLAVEGEWARLLYGLLARGFGFSGFKREEGKRSKDTPIDRANSFLDHGNYLAYGYASVALVALGISFAFPLLHGKTRRGALVFDVADLFKDALVMPRAFLAAAGRASDQEFRDELVDESISHGVIDYAIDTIKKASSVVS